MSGLGRLVEARTGVVLHEPRGTFPSLTEGESAPNWRATPDGVGIDRLAFSFPVESWADWNDRAEVRSDGCRTTSWRLRHAPELADGSRKEVGVFVSVREHEGRAFGKVECNPARFADPAGCSLLPPERLDAAVEVAWAAALEVTRPAVRPEDARVTRLDVARDFRGVTSPALYVEGLGPLRRPYARRSFTYNDPARASAQTLYVGSKAGGVRLYDQHAAYAEKGAPEGSLRFEAEARGGWLEKAGVSRLRDAHAESVRVIAETRWEWSRMGTTVTGPVNAVQVLHRQVLAGDMTQAVADRLLGAMVRQSFGYGPQSRRSEQRYRKVAGELGLSVAALWSDDLARQASGRLDFATGTEFLALTA